MIYVTSDTHFGDRSIIRYVHRPFDSVEEMDETIIQNINGKVKREDVLYILGDFTMNGTLSTCQKYLNKITCDNVYLIRGNHDLSIYHGGTPFKYIKDYTELFKCNTCFILSHYPFSSWNRKEVGSIMLHGHLHSDKRSNEINQWQGLRRFDVGVDANDFTPVSLEYIRDFFNKSLTDIFK